MKPMLAATLENVSQIRFPVLASVKLDGVRGRVINGKLLSRSLKPIPNAHVTAMFSRPEFSGLDGELIVGLPNAKDVYRATNSAVSREAGKPNVTFFVFDNFAASGGLSDRLNTLSKFDGVANIVVLEQALIKNVDELLEFERLALERGFEGLILRSPNGAYKQGRSTVNEGGMLKLKRFQDSEAIILAVEEEMKNGNAATVNELGHTQRLGGKSNDIPKGRAGSLAVRDVHSGVTFNIGSGFNDCDREWFWKNRTAVIGKIVKYKSFLIGVKDAPRFPVYLGGRETWDM